MRAVEDLRRVSKRIDELTAQVMKLAADQTADSAMVARLLRDLENAEAERRQTLRAAVDRRAASVTARAQQVPASGGERGAARAAIPVRERVLAALDLLGVPGRGGLV